MTEIKTKTLIITVPFSTGIEMECNLNKAIDELSSVLEKKGLMNITLEGKYLNSLEGMYTVEIKDSEK